MSIEVNGSVIKSSLISHDISPGESESGILTTVPTTSNPTFWYCGNNLRVTHRGTARLLDQLYSACYNLNSISRIFRPGHGLPASNVFLKSIGS